MRKDRKYRIRRMTAWIMIAIIDLTVYTYLAVNVAEKLVK